MASDALRRLRVGSNLQSDAKHPILPKDLRWAKGPENSMGSDLFFRSAKEKNIRGGVSCQLTPKQKKNGIIGIPTQRFSIFDFFGGRGAFGSKFQMSSQAAYPKNSLHFPELSGTSLWTSPTFVRTIETWCLGLFQHPRQATWPRLKPRASKLQVDPGDVSGWWEWNVENRMNPMCEIL